MQSSEAHSDLERAERAAGMPRRGPLPEGCGLPPARIREGISEEERGQAWVCGAHRSARDAVWDFLLLPAHVYFSLRLVSVIMRVYTKSGERRKAKPQSAVLADRGGSHDKH